MIVFSQKLKPVEQKIVQMSIWRNGFYAHPEEDEWEDEDDIDSEELILCTAEKAAIQYLTVREFQFPKINFKATSYPNLINWKKATFTEPPMTLDLSDEELRGLVEKPLFVPPYPCHTQAVERAIKLVSEAAGSVVGADSRDGYICQKNSIAERGLS